MNKLKDKLSTFGRQAFDLYDRYPLLCNTLAGSAVYSLGELVVQHQRQSAFSPPPPHPPPVHLSTFTSSSSGSGPAPVSAPISASASAARTADSLPPPPPLPPPAPPAPSLDFRRIGQIGLLGGVENGVFMLIWYRTLNTVVGASKSTATVLAKCFLDQFFFAAQSDGAFLALCALQHQQTGLADAMREVKRTFLTTWINDCSVWPLVNFIGFAAVPVKIQPTFMSCAQLFWQIYISGVAAPPQVDADDDDAKLKTLFRQIDLDGNGYLDTAELQAALARRGTKASTAEVVKMMAEAAKTVGDGSGRADCVSFEQFKAITKMGGANLKYAHLWQRVHAELQLEKGLKKSLQRLENKKQKDGASGSAEPNGSSSSSMSLMGQELPTWESAKSAWNTIWAVLIEKEDPNSAASGYGAEWKVAREHALQNSLIGGSCLVLVSVVRRFVFKI